MLLEAGRSFSPAVMSQMDDDEVDSAFHPEGVPVSFIFGVEINTCKPCCIYNITEAVCWQCRENEIGADEATNHLRTFALIVCAHPYCTCYSHRNVMPCHASSARAE